MKNVNRIFEFERQNFIGRKPASGSEPQISSTFFRKQKDYFLLEPRLKRTSPVPTNPSNVDGVECDTDNSAIVNLSETSASSVIGSLHSDTQLLKRLSNTIKQAELVDCRGTGIGSKGGHIAREFKAAGPHNGHNPINKDDIYKNPFASESISRYLDVSRIATSLNHPDWNQSILCDEDAPTDKLIRKSAFKHNLEKLREESLSKKSIEARSREKHVRLIYNNNSMLPSLKGQPNSGHTSPAPSPTVHLDGDVDNSKGELTSSESPKTTERKRSNQVKRIKPKSAKVSAKARLGSASHSNEQFSTLDQNAQLAADLSKSMATLPQFIKEIQEADHLYRVRPKTMSAIFPEASTVKSSYNARLRPSNNITRGVEAVWNSLVAAMRERAMEILYKDLVKISDLRAAPRPVVLVVGYVAILLGISPQWIAMKRAIFKELVPLQNFLNEVCISI